MRLPKDGEKWLKKPCKLHRWHEYAREEPTYSIAFHVQQVTPTLAIQVQPIEWVNFNLLFGDGKPFPELGCCLMFLPETQA